MKVSGLINIGILPLLLEAMTPVYAQHDQREQEPRQPQQHQEARPERQPQQARPERQQQPQQARPERQQQPQPQRQAPPARQQPNPERPQGQPRPARQPEQPKPAIRPRPAIPPEPRRPEAPKPARPAMPVQPEGPQRNRGPQDRPQQPGPKAQLPPRPSAPSQAKRPVQQVQREYDNQHRGAWQERRARNWQSEHRTWQDRGGYSGYRIPEARFRGFYGSSHPFRMFSFPLLVIGGFPRFQYGGLWFSVMDPWPEYWSNDWYGSDDLYIEYFGGGYYLHNRMHPMDRIAVTVFVS